jgi:hypothetical protein
MKETGNEEISGLAGEVCDSLVVGWDYRLIYECPSFFSIVVGVMVTVADCL